MLVRAVETGKLEEVKRLIEGRANVNETDAHKQTALHVAAQLGKTNIFQYLLQKKKIEVNVRDENGWTPLHWAANKGRCEICQLLLAHKNIKPLITNEDYNTPFLYFCRISKVDENFSKEYKKILANFLQRGADINERNRFGEAPLHYAVLSVNRDAVEFLCENNCNVNAINKSKLNFFNGKQYN